MRHVEIETVNKKLLDNMNKIMQSDYKSAVKTAISNRKFYSCLLLTEFWTCSASKNNKLKRKSKEGKQPEDSTWKLTYAKSSNARQEHF